MLKRQTGADRRSAAKKKNKKNKKKKRKEKKRKRNAGKVAPESITAGLRAS